MRLVKFDCGCIGLVDEYDLLPVVFKPCDGNRKLLFTPQNLPKEKTSQLSDKETASLLEELRLLIADGYRFRDVKEALGIPNFSRKNELNELDKSEL